MTTLFYIGLLSHLLFNLLMGWYLIINLQWYHYKIERVVFKHHKLHWHLFFFITPMVAYYFVGVFFWLFFYFTFVPFFYNWYKKLDKKLILTPRVKRFLSYLLGLTIMGDLLVLWREGVDIWHIDSMTSPLLPTIMPLALAVVGMNINELLLFNRYKKEAKAKIAAMSDLTIIQITASFGKTSIKNFLYELLKHSFKVHKTDKSINTLTGIVQDINQHLPTHTQIYIAESGARARDDIELITALLNPQIVILGKIGEQHIEYFKTIDNIRYAKMGILTSKRLKRAFVNSANGLDEQAIKERFAQGITASIDYYPPSLKLLFNTLQGSGFSLYIDGTEQNYTTNLLGRFNPENIAVAIQIAHHFGIAHNLIKERVKQLPFVPHRLQRIDSMSKIIIDDSFNSNLEGMREAIELASTHKGRKIIITCGLIESSEVHNITVAKAMDAVFDTVVITAELNRKIFAKHINKAHKFILTEKNKIEPFLSTYTKPGDLILFANDAPSYI